MRIALRSFIAVAAAGLTLAPAASADTTFQDLFVARDACGGADAPNIRLSSELGAFSSGCGSLAAGLGPADTLFATQTGDVALPVTLDVSRPVYVAVTISSDPGVVLGGIGDETVGIKLSGKRDSTTVPLGSATQTTPLATMLRQTDNVYTFELPLQAKHAGTYSKLDLVLTVGGSQQSGYVDYGGATYVSLPVPDPVEGPAP